MGAGETMASLLRQIVAGPRARHPEAGLDLCYVTDNIVATYVSNRLHHRVFPPLPSPLSARGGAIAGERDK